MESDADATKAYMSPIAFPLLEGKVLERSLRLIKKAVTYEKNVRMAAKATKESSTLKKLNMPRSIRRGVQEVTKALRKGATGILFLAADVHPVDIIAHLPILCEEKDLLYAFIGSKRTLGAACKSKRATSAILLLPFPSKSNASVSSATHSDSSEDYTELYEKVRKVIKATHPYF